MRKNWIWAIILVAIIALGNKLLIRFGGFDEWSGPGLLISIVTGALVVLIAWVLIYSKFYKKNKTRTAK